jgi:hypothetical protein
MAPKEQIAAAAQLFPEASASERISLHPEPQD